MTKKKRLGADLTPAVYDEFIAWCEAKGLGKGAAAEASFILLQQAPLQLRDIAMSRDAKAIRAWLEQAEYLIAREMAEQLAQVPPQNPPAGRRTAGGKR